MVTSKEFTLAAETEEERRASLENDAATKRLRLAMETDEERKALQKMVATTQLRLAMETEEERRAGIQFRFDIDLIWIEIGVFKNKISRNGLTCPIIRTIFVV